MISTSETDSIPEDIDKAERLQKVQQRAEALARTIGDDQEMMVRVAPRGVGTHWNWRDNIVDIDEREAERRTEEALGAIAHEGMHRRISRMNFIPSEIWNDLGFNGLLQTMEDIRVNTAVEQMYPGAGEWVRAIYQSIISERDLNANLMVMSEEIDEHLGYVPYTFEFCSEVQRKWAFGAYSDEVNPVVKEAIESVQREIDYVRTNIPPQDADEATKLKYAENGYIALRTKIWPIYEQLVEKDKENETIRQLMMTMIQDDKHDYMDTLLEEIDEDELEELTKYTEELKARFNTPIDTIAPSQNNETFNLADFRNMSSGLKSKMLTSLEKYKQKKHNEEQESKNGSGGGNKGDQQEERRGDASTSSPSLTPEEQRAEKILSDIEDIMVKALRPKMMDPSQAETHEEHEQTEMETKKEEERIEEIRKKEAEQAEMLKTSYETAYEEVASMVEELAFQLEDILYPNKASRWKKGYSSGSRATLSKAMQFEADPRDYRTMFERKTLADIREYRFTLLVDLSGSMAGGNDFEALKATVLFAEVLDRVGIKFEVIGFNTLPVNEKLREKYILKDYDAPLDKESKDRIGKIPEEILSYPSRCNDDGPALLWASERLEQQETERNFLFVISDGAPVYSPPYQIQFGDDDRVIESKKKYQLENAVDEVMKKNQYLVGLGIGAGVTPVAKYYRNNRLMPNVHQLPEVLGDLLRDIMNNPEKYQQ